MAVGATAPPDLPKQPTRKKQKIPLINREPVNDYERVETVYLQAWQALYQKGVLMTAEPIVKWVQSRKLLKELFAKSFTPDIIITAIKKATHDDFILSGGFSLTMILSASVFNRLVNAHGQAQKPTPFRKSHLIESDTMQEGDFIL